MINLDRRISAFVQLGDHLGMLEKGKINSLSVGEKIKVALRDLEKQIEEAYLYNGWFTKVNVDLMVKSISESLRAESLKEWVGKYDDRISTGGNTNNVGVIMAGNIPMVGFHDLLSVLISGNRLVAKLSSDDKKLIPALTDLLIAIEPEFESLVEYADGKLQGFDAIIATGSNNTSRYFDYYFGKFPNIIRKNRNGVAVLNGHESEAELVALSDDIFQYYGLGCRNVSKLFVPINYNLDGLLDTLSKRADIAVHSKYFNNYEYNKAIYLVNGVNHLDTGSVLLIESDQYASPVSVLYYEFYDSLEVLKEKLDSDKEIIQCIVSGDAQLENSIQFGKSQHPGLGDYADGIDTIDFLLSI